MTSQRSDKKKREIKALRKKKQIDTERRWHIKHEFVVLFLFWQLDGPFYSLFHGYFFITTIYFILHYVCNRNRLLDVCMCITSWVSVSMLVDILNVEKSLLFLAVKNGHLKMDMRLLLPAVARYRCHICCFVVVVVCKTSFPFTTHDNLQIVMCFSVAFP